MNLVRAIANLLADTLGVFADLTDIQAREVLAQLGVEPHIVRSVNVSAFRAVGNAAVSLRVLADGGENSLAAAVSTIRSASELVAGVTAAAGTEPVAQAAVIEALLNRNLTTQLALAAPPVVEAGRIFGLVPPEPAPMRLDLGALQRLLSSPGAHVRGILGWTSPAERQAVGARTWPLVVRVLTLLGVEAVVMDPAALGVLAGEADGQWSALVVTLSDRGPDHGVLAEGTGRATTEIELRRGRLRIELDAAGSVFIGSRLIEPTSGAIGGSIRYDSARAPADLVRVGGERGTRLTIGGVAGEVGVRLGGTTREWRAEAELRDVQLVVAGSDGDGFLSRVLGRSPIEGSGTIQVGWSSRTGMVARGSLGIGFRIALRRSIGPMHVREISAQLSIAGGSSHAVVASAGFSVGVELGPVSAAIDAIGIDVRLTASRGNLGVLGFDVGFKPPSGVSLTLSAGPVSGSGALSFEPDAGRYSGAVQLRIGPVGLNAFGLIETRAPGVAGGYSMVFLVSTRFTPVPLGLGFTLNGVGGLVGIHRTASVDQLRAGMRAGTLGNLLFPSNPESNASQILSTLGRVFPPAQDRHVFGPAFKIGWGTPTVLEADLGLLFEVPAPLRIVLLGEIRARFPAREAAIVSLNLDVLGVLDFGEKRLEILGHLHDSRIALFSVSGDLALRISWGERPEFLLSIGGFNPHFQAPAGFPTLDRVRFVLGAPSGNPGLTLEAYLAITSNSFQVGARAELRVEIREIGTGIQGYLHFDALILFDPFGFRIDVGASLSVRLFGIPLAGIRAELAIEGPTPWHIVGDAHISILFFEIGFRVDQRFGETHEVPAPTAEGWTLLEPAVNDARNWTVELPARAERFVTFAEQAEGEPVPVDPGGTLVFRQKVLPLHRRIVKVGETRLTGVDEFRVTNVRLGDSAVETASVTDLFAPGQYMDLSRDARLSRDSFERMDAGFSIAADRVGMGEPIANEITYEHVYGRQEGARRSDGNAVSGGLMDIGIEQADSAAARAGNEYAPEPGSAPRFVWHDAAYVIASTTDLTVPAELGRATGRGEARDRLRDYLDAHPDLQGTLQVVPAWEAA